MATAFKREQGPSAENNREDRLARLRALLGDGARLAPASAAQERFWVLAHGGEDPSFYHVAEAVEVIGELDIARLGSCLEKMIARHEVLRTGIASVQGKPVQLILSRVAAPLARGAEVPGVPLEEILRQEAARPFDLARPPLWRMLVVPISPGRHAVLTVFHHLISDGWSTAVFLREVLLCYMAELEGTPIALPPALQYREYELDRQRLLGEREAEIVRYWTKQLSDLPKAPTLPFDSVRPAEGGGSGAWLPFDLGPRGEENARVLARASETTLFGVFMAVFNATLHTLSGDRDLLVGTVVSGRHGRREWETVLGPLINSLILRTRIDEAESFRAFLSRSRDDVLQMLSHQDLPFDRVVEIAGAPRRAGIMPLTQVGIVYHEYPVRAPRGLPLTLHPLPFDTGRAQLDLALVIVNQEGRLRCRFEYDSRLLREETVRIARNVFLAILAAASARPEAALKDVCRTALPEMLPLLFTQHMRQIWQGEQVFGDPLLYRNTVLYTIPKAIDEALFVRAADFVVSRSDGLRAYVEPNGGFPRLRFAAPGSGSNCFLDFSRKSEPEAAFHTWLESSLHRPADLEHVPFRTDLARLAPDKHVWCISAHHMFGDGRMVMVLIERVSEVYRQLVAGRFEPDAAQYPQLADHLVSDLEYQRSARFRKDAAYWAKRLQGVGEAISFYGRTPRKATTIIDRVPCRIGRERTLRLLAMADQNLTVVKGVDAFLCNAFGVVLAAYLNKISGGAKRILFGSVTHNRRTPESKNIIGMFMQVIPHVLELDDGETFRSLMRKMDREMQAALRYGQYAVESPLGRPIYDVLLNYHKETPVQFDGTQGGYEVIIRRATQSFGVNVTNYDFSGDVELQFDFHRDVFDADKYAQAMAHFVAVIDALLENPDASIASLCLLGSAERKRSLVDFNATEAPFPLEKDLYTAFREVAAERPREVCASDMDGSISYEALLAASEHLAQRLFDAGARAEAVVPILADRGIPFLEAILAVFALGAAYLPLDPNAPSERLAHILSECGAAMVLVQPTHVEKLPSDASIHLLTLRHGPSLSSRRPTAAARAALPAAPRGTRRLAYVIYTSGSTGRPKGAMISQRGMMNHLYAKRRDLELGPTDVIVQNASQCFDISVWQFLSALVSGARTLIAPEQAILDPEALVDILEREGATVLEVVPSYLRVLLDHWGRHPCRTPLPSLRWLLVTGEALPPDLARHWLSLRPEVPLVNAYGPTECSDDVTHHFLRSAPAPWEHTVPIGRPIANTQLYVLDSGLQPVPEGVEGELCVGGDGVGLGYLEDDEKTRQAFIENPVPEGTSPLLYRTGDRVRLREDGYLEFHGRLDHQIKLRGYRIELGEIEAVLRAHPEVANAVVVVRQVQGVDALAAYVEPRAGSGELEPDLRASAARLLPSYMVPQHWLLLEHIPLTTNGKTDFASLPEPRAEGSTPAVTAPLSELERNVAAIWETVLEHPVHDPDADFFGLGGDSLRAIQALSLAAARGMRVRMQDFLAQPTVRGMALCLDAEGPAPVTPRPALDAPGEVPLVATQLRFLRASHGEPSHDNVAIWLSLEAHLAPHAEAALAAICAERDAFRLKFSRTDDEWQQFLGSETVPPVFLRRRLSRAAQGEALLNGWASEAQTTLDLERGVLAAGLLVEDGMPGRSLLLVVVHHLVSDAVSARLLLARLAEVLNDLGEGRSPRALRQSAGASSFTTYARELRRAVNSGSFDAQYDFWRSLPLERTTPLPARLPADNLVVAQRSVVAKVPTRLLAAEGDARSVPGGVAHAALSALVRALGRFRGPGAYAVGIVGTGREWAPRGLPVEGTVGWFNSYYPVVFDVNGEEAPAELSRKVRENVDRVPMGGFGYAVLRHLHPDQTVRSTLEGQGDPDIAFNYLGRAATNEQGLQSADVATGATRAPSNHRLAWLHAECWDERGAVGLRLDFNSKAFTETEVAQLLEEWQQGLIAVVDALTREKAGH
ncbi:MAG TPA: amino acid adenylation domain-containing protein [Polyangiaceae bacterium]|nr:amino acid adenylation domain-containing protein [Polyangiaceae bacterium]